MKYFIAFVFLFFSLFSNAQNTYKWNIKKGNIHPKNSQKDSTAVRYWSFVKNTLPPNLLNKYVNSIRLFSDGEENELGGMTPLNDQNSAWEIDIDTIDFNFNNKNPKHINDYIHTIIHEYGHLLTLNPEQVKITKDKYQEDHKGYLTAEGYATKNSYLGKFVTKFWPYKMLKKWDKIDMIEEEEKKEKALLKFHKKYKNKFVTDYASESPEEDIAESWTFFVLCNKPKLNFIKHQKIVFFYQFPELVKNRNHIRSKLKKLPDNYLETYP